MDTYTPMRAMIVCANGTGDYIKKEDAIKALQNIFEEDSQKIIEVFLKEFGYEDITSYVIFDDDQDMLYSQKDNFIHIDYMHGITKEHIEQAIKILNK